MTDAGKYISDQQQRLMDVAMAMAGHTLDGLAPGQIAAAAGCSASHVTRHLDNLRAKGWAEEIPGLGRWRLGPALGRMAVQHLAALDRAQKKMDEVRARYGGTVDITPFTERSN